MSTLPPFQLEDQHSKAWSFPQADRTLICFVKEDCPTCNLVLPLIEEIHKADTCQVLSPGQTAEGNRLLIENHSLTHPVLDDSVLKVSFAYDLDVVPYVALADDQGELIGDLTGFDRNEWQAFFDQHLPEVNINWDSLPEWRPGCGSLTQDPTIAARLHAESSNSPLRARPIEIAPADDIHEFMFDQGFTDGLPVVPPTPERVLRMLQGTSKDPQELVAVIPPNLTPATVEKVAINAVLAGCKPEYFPVVLATVAAICTDEFNCHGVFATTMGATPVMILNGPVRHSLNMNMQMSALGQGTRANGAIGRAVRLAVRNIGGAQPGGTERSTLGNPMKYSMCFAEWEERSPWEPLHVERGFEPKQSVVSVFAMSSGPAQVIDQTSRTADELIGSFALSLRAIHHVRAHNSGDAILVISPEHIDTLQTANYSKSELKAAIQAKTAVPTSELVADEFSGAGIPRQVFESMSKERQNALVPKFATDDHLHIVVAGSEAGKFSAIFHGWASGPMGSIPVSAAIEQ